MELSNDVNVAHAASFIVPQAVYVSVLYLSVLTANFKNLSLMSPECFGTDLYWFT